VLTWEEGLETWEGGLEIPLIAEQQMLLTWVGLKGSQIRNHSWEDREEGGLEIPLIVEQQMLLTLVGLKGSQSRNHSWEDREVLCHP